MNITIDTTIHFTPDGTEKFDAPFMRKAAQYIEANGLDDWDLKVRDGWDQTAKGAGKSRRVPIGYTLTKMTSETVGGAADVEPSNGVQREREADNPDGTKWSPGFPGRPERVLRLPMPGLCESDTAWGAATREERREAYRRATPTERSSSLQGPKWNRSVREAQADWITWRTEVARDRANADRPLGMGKHVGGQPGQA